MIRAQATASGKIILFGEHAVVYGRPAIAVPLTKVQANAELQAAKIGAGLRILAPDLKRDYSVAEAGASDPIAMIIRLTLQYLEQSSPPDAVLFISSAIPLGRGLGSGAAISTAIVRVLMNYYNRPLTPDEISTLVYEVEKLYHGTPSGIDNTVVAFEQPVYFVKQRPIQRMRVGRPFTLVVGDTGIVSPTHKAVSDLRRRWQIDPQHYEGYFDEIGAIANQARVAIERGASPQVLGKLFDENQEILQTLALSSPELDHLIAAAHQAGAFGAKLSGAGWGGHMIALVSPQPEAIEAVAVALREAGAAGIIVTNVG